MGGGGGGKWQWWSRKTLILLNNVIDIILKGNVKCISLRECYGQRGAERRGLFISISFPRLEKESRNLHKMK